MSLPQYASISGRLVQGPNGPSVATSHMDALAVINDSNLHESIKEYSSLTGGEDLIELMEA